MFDLVPVLLTKRELDNLRRLCEVAGDSNLAAKLKSLLAPNRVPSPWVTAARRQVQTQRLDNVSIADEGLTIDGDMPGDHLVLAWLKVNSDSYVEKMREALNRTALPEGMDTLSARLVRAQCALLNFPFPHQLMGNTGWAESETENSLELECWFTDPDSPARQLRQRFVLRFGPGTADIVGVHVQ